MWTWMRRLFGLALLAGGAYAAYSAWQRRSEPVPGGAPEWPPLTEDPQPAAPRIEPPAASAAPSPPASDRSAAPRIEPPAASAAPSPPASDQPAAPRTEPPAASAAPSPPASDRSAAAASDTAGDAPTSGASRTWVEPVDRDCPDGFPIKANANSGIYHVPGGRFYDRTVPERCYADEASAEADGYRRAKA